MLLTLSVIPGLLGLVTPGTPLDIPFIVRLIVSVVAVIGLWLWKKWGIYALAASLLISFYMVLITPPRFGPYAWAWANTPIGSFITNLTGFGIIGLLWFTAISKKWQYFE